MNIEVTMKEETAVLRPEGWLDTETAPALGEALDALPADVKAIELDCEKLAYVSSAGLRQIVAAYKKVNGALTLRHVSDEILHVLTMTGLASRLTIEP